MTDLTAAFDKAMGACHSPVKGMDAAGRACFHFMMKNEKAIRAALVDAERSAAPSPPSGWRGMDDGAPKDGTKIDVWADGKRVTDVWWRDLGRPRRLGLNPFWADGWVFASPGDLDCEIIEPTAWMPLPPPPEDRADG